MKKYLYLFEKCYADNIGITLASSGFVYLFDFFYLINDSVS